MNRTKSLGFVMLAGATTATVLLALAGGHSAAKHGPKPSPGGNRSNPSPGAYTFDQAVQAGIVPSLKEQLKESGLPLCPPPDRQRGGYRSAAALNAAVAKAPAGPTCMADPRGATFGANIGPGALRAP